MVSVAGFRYQLCLSSRRNLGDATNANGRGRISIDVDNYRFFWPAKLKKGLNESCRVLCLGISDPRMPATVLLIDDNAVQAATRQTILKRAGHFVIAALNPSRALEQMQTGEFPAEIQLVITDHLMPGMSGADFVRALRKTHPRAAGAGDQWIAGCRGRILGAECDVSDEAGTAGESAGDGAMSRCGMVLQLLEAIVLGTFAIVR